MQINFSLAETPSVCELILERRVGTIYKTFRPRTITFDKGCIKVQQLWLHICFNSKPRTSIHVVLCTLYCQYY